MIEFTPTAEQEGCWEDFESGETCVWRARAGAAKTSTLRLVCERTPRRGLVIYYNRAAKIEGERTFSSNAKVMTAHGLGYGAVGKRYQDRMDGPKITSRRVAEILNIDRVFDVEGKLRLKPWNVARLVTETMQRFCWSDDDEVRGKHVPFVRGAEAIRDELVPYVVAKARWGWNDVRLQDGKMPYQQDYYLKEFVMGRPRLRYGFIMADELQDANPIVLQLLRQQVENGVQVIGVGDSAQQIYTWRGSIDALDKIDAQRVRYLTKSFRFGEALAEEANKWLELLDEHPPIVGYEERTSTITDDVSSTPDAVLCRTNGEMVRQALEMIDRDVTFGLAGDGDKHKKRNMIKGWAEAAESLKAGRGTSHPDLYLFNTWLEVQDYVNEEPSDIAVMVRLIDKYGVGALKQVAAKAIDEHDADVILSTAHGAKGLEWRTVQIGDDFGMDDGIEPSAGESRLAYVAITRAQAGLHRGSLAGVDYFYDQLLKQRELTRKSINMDVFS